MRVPKLLGYNKLGSVTGRGTDRGQGHVRVGVPGVVAVINVAHLSTSFQRLDVSALPPLRSSRRRRASRTNRAT